MDSEVLVTEIANVDSAGAIVGELVGAGATDTEGRVCAWERRRGGEISLLDSGGKMGSWNTHQ